MPELQLTHGSEDEMEVDAFGDPDANDISGIPELTEDTVIDDDTPEVEPESRKRNEPNSPGEDTRDGAKRKRLGRVGQPHSDKELPRGARDEATRLIQHFLEGKNLEPDDPKQIVSKWRECINAISEIQQRGDVQQIIKDLEKIHDLSLPKNRR